MIDFDKVLEHVGGFGKYQITSKFSSIARPASRDPKIESPLMHGEFIR